MELVQCRVSSEIFCVFMVGTWKYSWIEFGSQEVTYIYVTSENYDPECFSKMSES